MWRCREAQGLKQAAERSGSEEEWKTVSSLEERLGGSTGGSDSRRAWAPA
jgi:hypothetical protein